jgi:hypothetical protein
MALRPDRPVPVMSPLARTVRRELRVAFSLRVQSLWFRVAKWTGILAGTACWHDQSWFWRTLAVLALAGLALHFFYRRQTKNWTCAWGGWDDLATVRDLPPPALTHDV